MSKSNNHIEEYLKYYLDPNNIKYPDFAVLITGDWGSGKTTFIKKFLKYKTPIIDNLKEAETLVIYVSLFGVHNRADIDERINEELKPFFKKKGFQLAGKAIFNIMKIAAMVKAGGDGIQTLKESGEIIEDALKILSKSKLKNTAIVFDDLERADMSLKELLGYINEYVEHQHIPCILIADEKIFEEADKAQKEQKDTSSLHKFATVKEKIIGKTFKVQTSLNEVLRKWLNHYAEKESSFFGNDLRKFLYPHREIILNVFETLECWNFRILKQSIDSWERFQSLIKKDFFKNESFTKEFLKTFFALEVWNRLGNLKVSDLRKYEYEDDFHMQYAEAKRLLEQKTENKLDSFMILYGKFSHNNFSSIMPFVEWYNWLVCGIINKKETNKYIENWFEMNKNNWLMHLVLWWKLSDEEFKEVLNIVFEKLKNKEITNSNTLLKIYDCFLYMEKEGREFTKGEFPDFNLDINTTFYNYLENLTEESSLNIEYCQMKNEEEFEYFYKKLSQKNEELASKNITKKSEDWLELIENSTKEAVEIFKLPTLKFADYKKFVNIYIKLEHNNKMLIIDFIKNRVTLQLEEREFLENVIIESKRHKKEDEFKPSTHAIRYLIQACEEAIKNLDKANK